MAIQENCHEVLRRMVNDQYIFQMKKPYGNGVACQVTQATLLGNIYYGDDKGLPDNDGVLDQRCAYGSKTGKGSIGTINPLMEIYLCALCAGFSPSPELAACLPYGSLSVPHYHHQRQRGTCR